MQKKHAHLLLGLSFILLLFVVVDFFKLQNKKEDSARTEQKTNLVDKANEVGQVLSGSAHDYIFLIKDSSNNSAITNATYAVNSSGCVKYSPTGYYWFGCDSSGGKSITVTKSGYQSKTTNVTEHSYGGPDVVVTLDPATSSSSGSSSSSPNSASTKTTSSTPVTVAPGSTVKEVALPSEFATGKSTNLSQISDTSKVENLTFDTKVSNIEFNELIDLSGGDVAGKFANLNEYVLMAELGVVSLDSDILPFLNKPATITMRKLTFVKTPRILVNGKEDKTVVSNITYKDGTLTFDVKHFSTFTTVPTVGIEEPANNFETSDKTIKIKGTVSDPTASVSAKLNNNDLGKLKVATNGAYEKEIDLETGENKIVVSALASNLATASASVSGVLRNSNRALIYALIGFLVVIGIGGIIYAVRHLRKKSTNSVNASTTSK